MKEYLDHMGLFHTDTHVVFEVSTIKQLPKPVTYKGKEYSKIRNIEVHRGLKLNEPCPVCGSHYPNPRCPNKGLYPAVQAFLAHEHQNVIGWIGSFLNAEHFSYCASINWTGEGAKDGPDYLDRYRTADWKIPKYMRKFVKEVA